MTIALLVLAAVALVAVSGLMAAAETAITSTSRAEIERIAETSRSRAALRAIAEDPSAHVNALTFMRVLLETMTVVLATLLLHDALDEAWKVFLIATGIMILVSFTIAGASPRSVARARAEGVLRLAAWPIRVCRIVVGPLADLLVAIGDRVTPGRPSRAGALTSEHQLLSMVDEAAEADVLEDEDRELIHSVIDFSDRLVREVMVARTDMVTIDDDATVLDALMTLLDHGYSRAPITGRDSDDVLGVVYTKDLARAVLASERGADAALDHARPARFVPESLPTDELLRTMQRERRHFALVVDEYGGIAGLVTLEDLIEELVGEIADEYDRAQAELEEIEPGLWRAPSRLGLADLGEELDRELEDEDVDSIGGLLAKGLGAIPEPGDRTTIRGLELTAERAGRRGRIETVLVRPLDPDEAAEAAGEAERDVVDEALDARAAAVRRERGEPGSAIGAGAVDGERIEAGAHAVGDGAASARERGR
ncbi:hypothetical protein USB125703_01640 [Pseudoclavibacter triregionum]|nr:hypothetical protein USB125703_01640 [Pseudoclavibacter triregionum]